MKISRVHPFTGKVNVMEVDITEDQLQRIQGGELIQNVVPHLNPDTREFMISGLTPGEFDKMFKEEDI